ncbi:hypothetical protein KGF54_003623 [Candida jiufengensis]|uniref:uncharacterized protein n=1 Tax=Candida jiufengensis TaxID=497108 RepID=UPI0022252CEB|nr:uncharacterized protein KGF54_003623 [Candida jiufengensis]KAI5952756.1 hypothetical protein KGF54_003623 [Candida jiufengensis]
MLLSILVLLSSLTFSIAAEFSATKLIEALQKCYKSGNIHDKYNITILENSETTTEGPSEQVVHIEPWEIRSFEGNGKDSEIRKCLLENLALVRAVSLSPNWIYFANCVPSDDEDLDIGEYDPSHEEPFGYIRPKNLHSGLYHINFCLNSISRFHNVLSLLEIGP